MQKELHSPKIPHNLDPASVSTLMPGISSHSSSGELEAITKFNQESTTSSGKSTPSGAGVATLSPHERIPSEIWAEIFSVIVTGLPICFPPDFSGPHWVLSRICSRWRGIALAEPRLWNSIEVTSTSIFSTAENVTFANRMISPSGPLSIFVNDTDDGFPSFSPEVLGKFLNPNLPRTRVLTLNLQYDGYLQFFQAPPESFGSLEVLEIEFGCHKFELSIVAAFQTTIIFSQARALRKLTLSSNSSSEVIDHLSRNIDTAPIPWGQLVELNLALNSLDLTTVLRLLHQCTNLQAFYVNMWDNHVSDPSMKDLVLPHLRSLTIFLKPYGFSFFDHLIVPTLTTLYVYMIWDSPSTYIAITDMLSRSKCPLSVFTAYGIRPDAPSVNMLMECMPMACEFTAHGLFVDKSTLEMIGRGQLLSSLTTLLCGVYSPAAFVDVLRRRLGQVEEGSSKGTALRSAKGYCVPGQSITEADMNSAVTILEGLNETYGTCYSLHWDP